MADLGDSAENAKNLRDLLKDVLKTQKQINEERATDLSITRDINNEIRESLKGVGKDLDFKQAIRKTLGQINKLSEQSFDFSKEELSISLDKENITKRTKKLTESITAAKRENEFIDRRISELSNEIQEGKEEENKLIQDQINSYQKVKQGLNDIIEESKVYSENLGQAQTLQDELGKIKSPKGFEALSDIVTKIPGLGKLSGPFKEAAKASKETAAGLIKSRIEGNNSFSNFRIGLKSTTSGFKALGPIITKALGPLAIAKVLIDIGKFFVDAMFKASKTTADFSRNLLISRDSARELYSETIPGIVREYNSIAKTQGRITILSADYEKTLGDINKQLGFQLNLSQDFGKSTSQNVAEAAMLQKQFGLSAEATTRLFLDAERTNQPLEKMTKEIFGQLGFQSTNAGLMADMAESIEQAAKVSGNLRANFRGSTAEIANAVFNAKILGLTLQQTEGIANSLLDFESSISAEMEAELLTGRQLNLEQARYNALMGDTDGLLEELNKQNLTQSEFLDMNIIQRRALAKSLGMEINEMADMFQQQTDQNALAQKQLELRNKLEEKGLSIKDANFDLQKASLQEIRSAAMKAGMSEEALRDILGEQIYKRKQAEDAQQRFNKSLDQAKEAFSRLVTGGTLDKLADILTGITESALFQGFREEGEAKRLATEMEKKREKDIEAGRTPTITQEELDIAKSSTNQRTGIEKTTTIAAATATGAAIGSVVPVIGTAAGAIIGFGISYLANEFASNEDEFKLTQKIAKREGISSQKLDLSDKSVQAIANATSKQTIKVDSNVYLDNGKVNTGVAQNQYKAQIPFNPSQNR